MKKYSNKREKVLKKKMQEEANTETCSNCGSGIFKKEECERCGQNIGNCCTEILRIFDLDDDPCKHIIINMCKPCFERINMRR